MCRTGAVASVLSSVLFLCDSFHEEVVCGPSVVCSVFLPEFIKTDAYCYSSVLSGTVTPVRALLCGVGLVFYSFVLGLPSLVLLFF